MNGMIRPAACLPLALLALAACQGAPSPATDAPRLGEASAAIYGTVSLPRRLVLVPSPPAYPQPPSPLPSGPVLPAAGAEVFCSDAAGTRIPGIPKVRANEDGAYRLHAVPIGYAYVVNAVYRDVTGRPLRLRALARLTDAPVEAPLDLATTVVSEAVLTGQAGLLGVFPLEAWQRAVQAATARLPIDAASDPGDAAQVAAAIARLQTEDAAWAADVEAMRASLGVGASPMTSP